jgi:di/tricarboxylate transporter
VTIEAWFTLAVVAATIGLLASERVPPPVAVLGAVVVLLLAGVIEDDQAFAGFANPAPISVAALYVLSAGAEKTGLLERITARILGSSTQQELGDRSALARITLPTAAVSALLNNTPIVAMVAPGVLAWTRRTGRSASRFLMPISFAAILGGLLTLIGTSTNLVVSGLLEASGNPPMGLFEIGQVGLPVAAGGLLMMVLFGPRLLTDRRAPSEDVGQDEREFIVEMLVARKSPLAGRSVADAGLRNLQGVYLVEIERAGRRMTAVGPEEVLVEGDRLTFAGNVGRVMDLQRMPGLVSADEKHFAGDDGGIQRRLYEAVVAEGSPLVGSTLKDAEFRSNYGAAVLAIHRAGQRIPEKLGEVVMRAGDVLLLLAAAGWRQRWLEHRDFLVVAGLGGDPPPRREKTAIVTAVIVALLAVVGTGLLDILEGALLSAVALVALKVLSPAEARNAVDLNVIVVIAGSFGVGEAIAASGLADEIARWVIEPLGGLGNLGLLAGVLLATMMLTELITNNAAAVLMFPIAAAAAAGAGLGVRPFAFAVALGASSSFLTPIGYQTNTMVYGMGGYRFGDFTRVGFPLSAVVIVVGLTVIPMAWPFAGVPG